MYTKHPVECVHHFVFEPPKGKFNIGTCKHCGERVESTNYFDTTPLSIWKSDWQRYAK
jgi:hypothetical protein|tara:strand:+ start:949 stop:1122 length:174 start_codon:yes stop_codon:yes gene_type:complete